MQAKGGGGQHGRLVHDFGCKRSNAKMWKVVAEALNAGALCDLGNELVWLHTQIQHVPSPHIAIMAAVKPRPHRIELNADAFVCLL